MSTQSPAPAPKAKRHDDPSGPPSRIPSPRASKKPHSASDGTSKSKCQLGSLVSGGTGVEWPAARSASIEALEHGGYEQRQMDGILEALSTQEVRESIAAEAGLGDLMHMQSRTGVIYATTRASKWGFKGAGDPDWGNLGQVRGLSCSCAYPSSPAAWLTHPRLDSVCDLSTPSTIGPYRAGSVTLVTPAGRA